MIATIKNALNGIAKKAGKIAGNPYKKLGISWMDLRALKNAPTKPVYRQKFMNGVVEFKSMPEFIHALDEIFVAEIYKLTPATSPRILDCGGNIGMSGIYFKQHYPDARLTIFEPDDENYKLLKRNMELQQFTEVELRKEAVWVENTTLVFQSAGTMSSKIMEDSTAKGTTVTAVRLKDFLTEKVFLLKMDIEGAEYQVVKDIKDRLHLVENIFIEYHGTFAQQNELMKILTWLTHAGLSFYIKEAHSVYPHPFVRTVHDKTFYDVQLNIFGFRAPIT